MTNSKKIFAFLSLLSVMLFSFSAHSSAAYKTTGYVPFPVDLSYLMDNPPVDVDSDTVRSAALPTTYDLRSLGRIPARIVDQGDCGICWACAAIAAMESNYMTQGKPDPNLSEMHLAYFAMVNTNKYKAFMNFSSDSPLLTASETGILNQGLNFFGAAAIYSRLDGPVSESDVPFDGRNPKRPQYSVPESYSRVLRLREAYFLAQDNLKDSRDNIKKRIMENGAVCISYYSDEDNYNKINGHTTYYTTSTGFNHGVVLVGWDDNFSRDNFSPKPSNNGAWLVRNSYGSSFGDNGYFWMSYDTVTDNYSTAFIVEEADSDMKCYYYDALGWCANKDIGGTYSYAANIFVAERDDEKIKEVGFYTPNNNVQCQIKIYTNLNVTQESLNSIISSANPTSGTLAFSTTVTIPYAGYHTINVSPNVSVAKNRYFSVVIRLSDPRIPTEEFSYARGFIPLTPNIRYEKGSFYSSDGSSWSSMLAANACIKAFTITSSSTPSSGLTINSTFKTGKVGENYEDYVSVSGGTAPYTWGLVNGKGQIPAGLEGKYRNDDTNKERAYLVGIPTAKGTYKFTIRVVDSAGKSAEKDLTVTITDSNGNSDSGSGGGGGGCDSGISVLCLVFIAAFTITRRKDSTRD